MRHPFMNFSKPGLFFLTLLFLVSGCASEKVALPHSTNFEGYWYPHGAEVTRYQLEQARYGEMRSGEAIFVFVTEPFLADLLVKAEEPESQKRSLPVLKLNALRQFPTGLYNYSSMTSSFVGFRLENGQALDPHFLKMTTSVQEWCGQVFLQFNRRGEAIDWQQFSYFEAESDRRDQIKVRWVEDEIWALIRMAPERLPQGDLEMIPGGFFLRMRHRQPKPETVRAELEIKGKESRYILFYPQIHRTLRIHFNGDFPHDISYWEEEGESGYGDKKQILKTRARRSHALMIDYWSKNGLKHEVFRKKLGIN